MKNEIVFENKLYELRKEMNLTQKQLADNSGVDEKIISRIECHSGNPNLVSAARLARYFGLTVDELFVGFKDLGPSGKQEN